MPLPVLTTVEDIETIVNYLKAKATGATLKEAKAVLEEKYLDGRKLKALEFWGFISANEGRIALTDRGRALARTASEERSKFFRQILYEVGPYRTAMEWAHHQGLDSLPTVDVAARWNQYNREEVGTESETTLGLNAVCMFHIAQAASLGTLTIGRRGSPTRLDIDKAALRAFVEVGEPPPGLAFPEPKLSAPSAKPLESVPVSPAEKPVVRVFVSHGKNAKVLDQIKKTLEFGGLDYVVAEEEETTAIPVPDKIMQAMHRCNAGIINISADEKITDAKGKSQFKINENVLIEIGAAFVLYKKKVILVVDKRVQLPSNLRGLYRCDYEGDALDWETGLKLQETLTRFRKE